MLLASDIRSNTQLITQIFAPLIGKRLLDVGCGSGSLVGTLLKRGAVAVGVDADETALWLARTRFPEASLHCCALTQLPFDDETFDGAILVDSLQHLSAEAVEAALGEALRVVKARGRVLVIEALASKDGPPPDAGAGTRAVALAALDRLLAKGRASEIMRLEYDSRQFATAEPQGAEGAEVETLALRRMLASVLTRS